MKHFRFGIAMLLAAFAAQALAAPGISQPPASPQLHGRRSLHKKHAQPERHQRPARPAKVGSVITAPAVKGVIANDFKMNTDSLPYNLERGNLAAAMQEDGTIISVWTDERTYPANVIFQRFTRSGQPIGSATRANAQFGYQYYDQRYPSVAVAPNGTFAIAWEEWRGTSAVICRVFDSAGAPLGADIRVDEAGGGGYDMAPSIAATDSGYAVVWSDYHTGSFEIYLQMMDTLGGLVGSNVMVNEVTIYWQDYPQVSKTGQGFVVCWHDGRDYWDIYAKRYDDMGNPIGGEFRVNDNAIWEDRSTPVACGTDSGFAIAWTDHRNFSSYEIYLQRYDTSGAAVGGERQVTSGGVNAYKPSIASAGGRFAITWHDARSGNDDVYTQWFKPNGDTLGGQVMLNDDASGLGQDSCIAVAGDSGWAFIWMDKRSNGWPLVYGQGYDTGLTALGPNFMACDSIIGLHGQYNTAVAEGQDGSFMAVWVDRRNDAGDYQIFDIYGRLYSGNGAALTPDFLISDTTYDPGYRESDWPTVEGLADGSYMVAWSDYRNGSDYDVFGQRISAAGNPTGANFLVSTAGAGIDDYDVSIAAADSGFGVFWDDGDYVTWGRVYKTNGDSVGPAISVSDFSPPDAEYPCATANVSGLIVTWEDYRDGNYYKIYGQRMMWNGTLSGGNYLISDSLDTDQEGPSIAGGGDGFLTVWYVYRNGLYDIHGQFLDATGQRTGPNFAISMDTTIGGEYPSVAASPDGSRYAVFWKAYFGGRAAFLTQRYQNGLPQGTNEMLIDTTGWLDASAYSNRSAAASDNRLFFTWAGNRGQTGSDVFGKITDWYATALPPAFAWVDSLADDPDSAYGPYPVKAKITDDGGVAHAVLYYQIDGGAWDTLGMSAGAADTFNAAIPEQSVALGDTMTIAYYVWAMDNTGNWINSPARTFRLTHPSGVAGRPEGTLPAVYALRPCYPNPSSGRVSFGYQLPKASEVCLTVYNIAGQAVKQFKPGIQPAGSYTIDWSDRRVSAGVYIYRLRAGSFTASGKVIFLR